MYQSVACASSASITVVYEYALIPLAGVIRTDLSVKTIDCSSAAYASGAAIPVVAVIRQALRFETAWFAAISESNAGASTTKISRLAVCIDTAGDTASSLI